LFLPLIQKDVGISFTQAGLVSASANVAYAVTQLPSGYLADRLGAKRLFILGLVGASLLTFGFSLLHAYPLLLGNQAVGGVFRSMMFAPGVLLITALFPERRRATAIGLYVAGGFGTNIVLNLIGPAAVPLTGWRGLFQILSAAGLLVVILFWKFGQGVPPIPEASRRGSGGLRAVLGNRAMWIIGGIQFVRLAVAQGLSFWLPTFIVVEKHQSLQIAGLVLAMIAALTVPSTFLGGYISDRTGRPLVVIGVSLVALAITTFLMLQVRSLPLLFLVLGLNGVFVQLYFGPLFALPIQIVGPRTAGLASGFGNLFANIGGTALTFAIGALKDVTGSFDAGFYSLTALCLVGLAFTVLLSLSWHRSGVD
jgi:sugar phosphate permease